MNFAQVRQDVRDQWKADHHLLGFVLWKPFKNEAHFNLAVRTVVEELNWRTDFDWDGYEGDHEQEELAVMSEIVNVVVRMCFPNVNLHNVIVRAGVRVVAGMLVKRLHDEMREQNLDRSEYPEQVRQCLQQAKALSLTP